MKNKVNKRLEIELYKPVEEYFAKKGYIVHGEVNDCDVVAIKGEELIIIELKTSLNVGLLIQASKRQRLTEQVYIAIPKPSYSLYSKKWKDTLHLIRRLELGLLLVSFLENIPKIESVIEPKSFDRARSMRQSKKKRNKMFMEITGRTANYNVGGSTQTKIMTAYKEKSIHIARCLEIFGPLSPKKLRDLGTGKLTQSILSKNYNSWFDKVERGIYQVSIKGISEIKESPEIVQVYDRLIHDQNGKSAGDIGEENSG